MKVHSLKRQAIKLTLLAGTLWAFGSATSHAALFYLETNSNDWNAPAFWNSAPDGSGTDAPAMSGNDFNINGKLLGTSSGDGTFLGDSLDLGAGSLNLRNGGTKTFSSLTSSSNAMIFAGTSGTVLSVTDFTLSGGTTTLQAAAGGSLAFLLTYNIGTLSGAGNLALDATATAVNKTLLLNVSNGSGYTGNITWADSDSLSLQFGSDTVFGGGLVALSTSRITLDQDVTFSSVTLGGTSLGAGYYDYAYLNTNFADIFNEGGSGSITVVPEPSSWALGSLSLGLFLTGVGRRRGRNLRAPR